jgi:hypothetical protein
MHMWNDWCKADGCINMEALVIFCVCVRVCVCLCTCDLKHWCYTDGSMKGLVTYRYMDK